MIKLHEWPISFNNLLKKEISQVIMILNSKRGLNLLYDIEIMCRKTIKHACSMFHTLMKYDFFINRSSRRVLSMLYNKECIIIIESKVADIVKL